MKGSFSEDALEQFTRLAAEKQGLDFAEGEVYDFARCVRSDGSFYGTGGKCRKGTEAGAKEEEAPKTAGGKKRRATAEAKKEAKAASRAAAGAKVSANAARTRALKEELEKIKDKMKGASPEEQNRLIQGAMDRATERSKVTATPGMAAKVKAAKEKLKAEKAANGGKRTDRLQEERSLERNRQQREMDRKVKETRENSPRVKDLQDRIARGDKTAMEEMRALRAAGKVGKEPGFAPGQKARNDAKEAANVKAGKSPVADVKPARKPRDRALTAKEQAALDAKTGRLRPSSVAEGIQREQMRAERAERKGTQAGDSGKKV